MGLSFPSKTRLIKSISLATVVVLIYLMDSPIFFSHSIPSAFLIARKSCCCLSKYSCVAGAMTSVWLCCGRLNACRRTVFASKSALDESEGKHLTTGLPAKVSHCPDHIEISSKDKYLVNPIPRGSNPMRS